MTQPTTAPELDAQRFPIGRFQRLDIDTPYSDAERTAFIERLALLPAHVASAIDGLTDEDFARPYRPGGWTVGQLVHHIADSHANAYVRVKLGLTEDTPTIKPYDQDAWVALADSALDPHVSLMMLTAVHARLVAVVRAMTPAEFRRRLLHPENGPMTLDQLVALYAWHGDHHVAHLEAYKAGRAG
ncbi:MAG: YfiT family bacillithiol transferase [Gemmatimonas sp.]|jgi:hypothetical protein|uniref:YfiT family bacillithiol transferase n=1 Tax=Gemmatimonas sp. TaxID=1962908 RepID=UPI00391F9C78|nr:putative metal-dependent hydrolase [Gemmatimonadota bacterium]